jgi:hypothetical protein
MAQGGPEFKPQYCKTKTKTKKSDFWFHLNIMGTLTSLIPFSLSIN